MKAYKSNLPLTLNWWRDEDKPNRNRGKIDGNIELDESLLNDEEDDDEHQEISEAVSKDEAVIEDVSQKSNLSDELYRGTTLDQIGDLDISNIGQLNLQALEGSEGRKYEMLCMKLGIAVSRKLVVRLDKMGQGYEGWNDVNLKHYGLDELGVCVIASTIRSIGYCTSLDLEGNKLSKRALTLVVGMLQKTRMEHLNLSATGISRYGPKLLAKWLSNSKYIKSLCLRENQLNDEDGMILFDAVSSNRSLVKLDLAHNNFFVGCSAELKVMIEDNDLLEELDLSWNNLRLASATSLARGLKKNSGLTQLKLGWNGFGDIGCVEIGSCLKENETLEVLDLYCNRITDEGLGYLMDGIEKNSVLKVLKVGRNNISQEAVQTLLNTILDGRFNECALETLDLKGNIYLSGLQVLVDKVKEEKPTFSCLFGYENSYGVKKSHSNDPISEAMQFLRRYVDENNINLVELFEKFDVDGSMSVTYDEFRMGLKDAAIPVTDYQVDQLIQYLDADGDGEIDFSELVIATESHARRAARTDEHEHQVEQEEVPIDITNPQGSIP